MGLEKIIPVGHDAGGPDRRQLCSQAGTREGPGIRDARRWIDRMLFRGRHQGDRCSQAAAGHDVLELTVHGLGEVPYPTATLVADVIQKANQSSSGGHSGGGTVIMQPIATQSRSWALRSGGSGDLRYLSRLIPLYHLTEQVRVRSPQPLICAAGRRGGYKPHFHSGAKVATAACIAAEQFKSHAAFHKRTSRGHPHSRKRNRAAAETELPRRDA